METKIKMKKHLIFLVFALLLSNLYAQENIIGSWLVTKAQNGEKVQQPYYTQDFREDGSLWVADTNFGTWQYTKDKTLLVQTQKNKQLNGKALVLWKNADYFMLHKDGWIIHHERLQVSPVNSHWEGSNLLGNWVWQSGNTTWFLILLKDQQMELTQEESGMRTTHRGLWYFFPDKAELTFVNTFSGIRGGFEVLEKSSSRLRIRFKEALYDFVREETKPNLERLSFSEADFPEGLQDENNLPGPWVNDFQTALKALQKVAYIKYRIGKQIKTSNALQYSSLLRKITLENENIAIRFTDILLEEKDSMQIGEHYKNERMAYDHFFFPEKTPDAYRVIGLETIDTPAGKQECYRVDGVRDGNRYRYYMLYNIPGVFAKIISEDTNVWGEPQYTVWELVQLKLKTPTDAK